MASSSSSAAAAKVDTVVMGAGVIGLAVARALSSRSNSEVLLLERAHRIGSETSSRNSEVLHAGIYYPTDSRKAAWCVRGKHLLYDYCRDRGIPHRRCGKLVVATAAAQRPVLQQLHRQAARNGVPDTVLLSPDETRAREPGLTSTVVGALHSPSTGIVDSHALMVQLLADAEAQGHTTLALHTAVDDAAIINNNDDDYRIRVHADGLWLSCRRVVNATGLWASHVASFFQKNRSNSTAASWQPPRQYFCKGTYVRSSAKPPPFSTLIYPVPDPRGGLGVHATLDLQGQVKFGPDVEWLDADATIADDDWYQPDPARVASFYEPIRRYWPDLPDGALVPDYCGVRPKLQHPSRCLTTSGTTMPFSDFVVAGPETHGVPGLVHLLGMESPGLTASLAIAEHVAALLLADD